MTTPILIQPSRVPKNDQKVIFIHLHYFSYYCLLTSFLSFILCVIPLFSHFFQQFKAHMVLQYSYRDSRLDFRNISKNRDAVMGQEILRDKIWVPHVIVRNEKDTVVMGSDGKDVFVTISANGQITYSYRMTLTFYCWMNLKKFPFDIQLCDIIWNSCKCEICS